MATSKEFTLYAVLVFALVSQVFAQIGSKGGGFCPLPRTVTLCNPRCTNDFMCFGDKKCCPNSCGSTSCTSASPVSTGNDRGGGKSGANVYCGNEKCKPNEKCGIDRSTKRQKCVRN